MKLQKPLIKRLREEAVQVPILSYIKGMIFDGKK